MTRGLVGRLSLVLVFAVVLVGAVGVSSAFAGSAWWGVTVSARPSYLQAGQGRDEVQEVKVNGGEGQYELIKPATGGKDLVLVSAGASAGEVQHKLEEEEMYGAHNVSVRSVAGPAGGRAFQITFVKELEDQSIAVIEAKKVEGAAVSASQVSEGRPDGIVVVNFVNRGEAFVEPVGRPVTVADVLPPGMKALAVEAGVNEGFTNGGLFGSVAYKLECTLASVSCVFTGKPPAGEKSPEGYPLRVPPYVGIQLRVAVKLTEAKPGAMDEASVSGGNAPAVSVRRGLTVSSAPEPFGVGLYELSPEESGGGVDTQAGSHPFQVTTSLMFNDNYEGNPLALPKDLSFKLPPGLIGNPEPFTRCTLKQFLAGPQFPAGQQSGTRQWCPQASVIGVARIYPVLELGEVGLGTMFPGSYATLASPWEEPVFNLEPESGEPARFGFAVEGGVEFVPVLLDTSVRTGGDYGVTVDVRNITQTAYLVGSEVTLWGVPGDARHNKSRGEECLQLSILNSAKGPVEGECEPYVAHNPPPFFSLPTSCTGPLLTSVEADSWREPGVFSGTGSTAPLPGMDGCNRLPFTPSIKVTPDATEGSMPTGLNVDVHVPQDLALNPTGLSESEVRNITVALPEGVAINPSGGDGLEACPEALIGYKGQAESPWEPGVENPVFPAVIPGGPKDSPPLLEGVNFCANASKIGTVTIRTPLLPNPLEGAVYLASQEANPFGSLIAMYLVAQDPVSGSVVELPGVVHLTASGQIVSTFEDNPQLPFEDAELHFFGGERAPLASPVYCGAYTTRAEYTPWSGNETVDSSSTFNVNSGPSSTANPGGTPCPGQTLAFDPTSTGGATNIQAGAFSPFTTTFSRAPGEQDVQSAEVKLPPGVLGTLPSVELCREPQAGLGECGPGSEIGETTVSVGVGGDPFTVRGGRVYITGPYNGSRECTVGEAGCAPFGLSVVNPAKAGPFDVAATKNNHPACDCILVRAKVEVDPITGALTITSNPPGTQGSIPTIIEGIPLQIQHVNITTTRADFQFNPTNCSKMKVEATLHSSEGGVDHLEVPFQVTNCATLGFKPKFSVSTSAKPTRLGGTSLNVKLAYPQAPFGSQANIKQVKVELPRQLPSRLPTLQKACTAAQFKADPAGCPAASVVGHAKAVSPLLPVPLEGPAYFVSNGGEAFPNLIVVLQGYGVTIDLIGDTFISKQGVTSSTFKTVPDAPVESFELNLPAGKYSALTALGNPCKEKLVMPTEFIAQNGAELHQNTKIEVTGCGKTKQATHKQKHHKKPHHNTKAKKAAGKRRGGKKR